MEPSPVPSRILICHDDYHASRVGRLDDGRQFFVTTPFVPALGHDVGREFIAVYLFDASGAFLEARIDNLGPRPAVDQVTARALLDQRVAELGGLKYGDVSLAPFAVARFGTTFGLIPRAPDDDEEAEWCVEAEPGNYMAFFDPWDGYYDT